MPKLLKGYDTFSILPECNLSLDEIQTNLNKDKQNQCMTVKSSVENVTQVVDNSSNFMKLFKNINIQNDELKKILMLYLY